jgi:hypothetical protein
VILLLSLPVAGIISVYHHAWPLNMFLNYVFIVFLTVAPLNSQLQKREKIIYQ